MAQSFNIGEQVMVLYSSSRNRMETMYELKEVAGFYEKNPRYNRYSYRSSEPQYRQIFLDVDSTQPALTGPYVKVVRKYEPYTCTRCNGTGKMVPEGFDPNASYRVDCETCKGTGMVQPADSGSIVQNHKDKVMSLAAYQPIADAKAARLRQQREREQARKNRVQTHVQNLLEAAQDALSAEDPALELAKYLLSVDFTELHGAASRLKKLSEAACQHPGCGEPAEWRNPADSSPDAWTKNIFCYPHYEQAQRRQDEARRAAEAVM